MNKERVIIFIKSKYFVASVIVVVILTIGYQMGYSSGFEDKKALIDEEQLSYDDLKDQVKGVRVDLTEQEKEIEKKQKELKGIEDELSSKAEELKSTEEELADLIDLKSDRDKLRKEKLDLETDVAGLNDDITSLEKKLSDLKGGVERAEGDPKHLGAGQFLVGMDLPPNRYEVFPEGRGSNFVVRGGDGSLKVNTILGSHGVPSYVFIASEGDYIETGAPVRFEPVE